MLPVASAAEDRLGRQSRQRRSGRARISGRVGMAARARLRRRPPQRPRAPRARAIAAAAPRRAVTATTVTRVPRAEARPARAPSAGWTTARRLERRRPARCRRVHARGWRIPLLRARVYRRSWPGRRAHCLGAHAHCTERRASAHYRSRAARAGLPPDWVTRHIRHASRLLERAARAATGNEPVAGTHR